MSKHIFGYKAQRRVVVAIAAAASMLLAVNGPVAIADTGTGGAGSKGHTHTGDGEIRTNRVTSTVNQPLREPRGSTGPSGTVVNGMLVRSGSQSTVLHNKTAPTAAPDPGITFRHNTDPVHNQFVNTLMSALNPQHTGDPPALNRQVPNGNALTANNVVASPNTAVGGDDATPASDTDFMRSPTINFFGLFSTTSFADPDDNEFVATDFSTPFFTDILTSGADPSDSVGFGTAGIGVPGETVNTFESPVFPFLDNTIAIPVTDPFAELFTALLPFGF
jgi:hypothetical protein